MAELGSMIRVSIPKETERLHGADFDRARNFLKHADRDHDQALCEDEARPDLLLVTGCNLYFDLMGRLTPEMHVWMADRSCVRVEGIPTTPCIASSQKSCVRCNPT